MRFALANRVKWLGPLAGVAALSIGLGLGAVAVGAGSGGSAAPVTAAPTTHGVTGPDGLGIQPRKIKHVWLIVLEHKSYDATFTGLNNNTYLWKTLPDQGVLLKQYHGTGLFSLDNYISMASGQAPQPDVQADCPYYDKMSGAVDTLGSLKTNPNYGQIVSAAGANAAPGGQRMCVPEDRPDTVQPARRRWGQLEGIRAGPQHYRHPGGRPQRSGS